MNGWNRGPRKPRGNGLLACALLGCPLVAAGDVTTRERVQFGGALGAMAKMTIENSTSIAGDKARIDTKVTCGNLLVRAFCPGDGAQIVRLDRDTTWQLDLDKRTWYEETFANFRRRQEIAAAQMRKAQAAQAGREDPPAEPARCEPEPARSDVQNTGEKGSFAGLQAERTTVTVTQACKDRETGSVCETRWVADQWLAPADAVQAEQQRFWQAYAQKLLRDAVAARTMAAQALAYMESHRTSFTELARRLGELQGAPLKYTLALAVGGAGCEHAAGAGGSPERPPAEKPSIGGAIAGAIGGSLGGALFKRSRKKETQPADAQASWLPPGYVALFEMSTEVTSVETAPVAGERFEVPAGFRRIEPPPLPAE